jgi:hypothetical protein
VTGNLPTFRIEGDVTNEIRQERLKLATGPPEQQAQQHRESCNNDHTKQQQ